MSDPLKLTEAKSTRACGCSDDCCGGEKSAHTTAVETLVPGADVRAVVREKYGDIAEGRASGCGCGCGCSTSEGLEQTLSQLGYSAEQASAIPEGANLGLGCGNPIAHAQLRAGETVLDLGSGAGLDCFLAAREVGPTGRVIGVDMTASMIERARALATQHAFSQVEFRLGEIEHLPVESGTVDCIVSNCVVNLSPDKPQVFRDALRVLKPGGRLVVSDLVLTRALTPQQQQNVALYVGCVSGASQKDDYLRQIAEAGFTGIEVLEETRYMVGQEALAEGSEERDAFSAVVSVKVRAVRPVA